MRRSHISTTFTPGRANPTPAAVEAPLASSLPLWLQRIPFLLIHVACLAIFLTRPGWLALGLCAGLYLLRMFGITAGYHRYFSHRSYKTSRVFQFVLAWLGCSALQKGPLWWASHHRHHHRFSDTKQDTHSPIVRSLWWSHIGWVLARDYEQTEWKVVRDWQRIPELCWLNRYHWVPGLLLAIACYLAGGWSGLVWGFFLGTVLLYHATFTVNSLCHLFGSRRYHTKDQSRNNALVALFTLGEGWHNNHHHHQGSANQGFFWWEIDVSYYVLRLLAMVGLIWDVRHFSPRRRSRIPAAVSAPLAASSGIT